MPEGAQQLQQKSDAGVVQASGSREQTVGKVANVGRLGGGFQEVPDEGVTFGEQDEVVMALATWCALVVDVRLILIQPGQQGGARLIGGETGDRVKNIGEHEGVDDAWFDASILEALLGVTDPLVNRPAGLGDDAVGIEGLTKDRGGEGDHVAGAFEVWGGRGVSAGCVSREP